MKHFNISLTAFAISSSLLIQAKDKPNILWLTFEDTSPHFIGCYGNEQAKTPNIDRLAKEGVRFDAAYANAAVSSPSRFCLFTGLRTTSMGTGHLRSAYQIPENVKGFPYYLRQAGYYTSNNMKTDYNIANAKKMTQEAWHESSNNGCWGKRKPGQPFFAVYNSVASHQSRTMTNTWEKYEEEVLGHLKESEIIPFGDLQLPSFYRNSPTMQKNVSRVYNSIQLMDKEFGEWLDRLEREGLKDSTIIFCFSDHGQGITRGKGSALGLGYKVPFVAWFPPMYKHLSPWGDGLITDELVSFEDMAPTVLRLAGVALPDYMKGRVFAGEKPNQKRQYVFSAVDRTGESSELSRSISDGRYLFTRVFMPFQPFVRWNMYYDVSDLQNNIRADYNAGLLNEKQRWILEERRPEYLFDLENDPWEMVNLIEQPEMKAKADELRSALITDLVSKRDAHFMPEYAFKVTSTMPSQLALDEQFFPMERVMDAALMVGKGENQIIRQFLLLSDNNQFVRYWATMGLFAQQGGLSKYKRELEMFYSQENYAPVSVNLSVLMFKISDKQSDTKRIKELIKNEKDPELLRNVLHLLTTLKESKQLLILHDIENRLEQNELSKAKNMNACNDLMTLMLHKLKGLPIGSKSRRDWF